MSSGVEFEEDKFSYSAPRPATTQPTQFRGADPYSGSTVNQNDPKMVQWLVRKGFAKSASAAQGVLIAIVIINIVITYIVISYFIL